MFDRVPLEMRNYAQWVNWRITDVDGKPTKPPLQARNGQLASVTDPTNWSDFRTTVANVLRGLAPGIGFVLTHNDAYTMIDLDNKEGDPVKHAAHVDIVKRFNSYTEISPSGKGVHIIVRGAVPRGVRDSLLGVEVYSVERYMTMTGQPLDGYDLPIANAQSKLDELYAQLGGDGKNVLDLAELDRPETLTDEQILEQAAHAKNGELFRHLWAGNFAGIYPSQSEADQALVNILAFYTDNVEQVKRLFWQSALGERPKAKRDTYINPTVRRAFDQKINTQAVTIALRQTAAKVAAAPATVPETPPQEPTGLDTPITTPPGLMGDLLRFVLQASPRPVPQMALAAAIGFMSGAGRAWNVSATGLNMYVLAVAATGSGKEIVGGAAARILSQLPPVSTYGNQTLPAMGAHSLIGPGEIASGQGIIRWLSEGNKSFVSIIGEFGLKLRNMAGPHASPTDTALLRMLLDLYGKSGKTSVVNPTAYSDKTKNTQIIQAPSFSFLGETTPETLYRGLDESLITNGLLPRILTLTYTGPRVPLNEHAPFAALDNVEGLRAFVNVALKNIVANEPTDVKLDTQATLDARALSEYYDARINGDAREVSKHLWNRAHLKILKLAALVAVGVDPYAPIITPPVLAWARTIVESDIVNLLRMFDTGEFTREETSDKQREIDMARKIIQLIENKPTSDAAFIEKGAISHRTLSQRVYSLKSFAKSKRGEQNAVKDTIAALERSGLIVTIPLITCRTDFNTGQQLYGVVDLDGLNRFARSK